MINGNNRFLNQIPPVTLNLIIINALMLLATFVFEQTGIVGDLNYLLGLHYFEAEKFNSLQLISYMFLHANISHLFFNMFSLFMFGRILESYWGSKRFLIYYLVTGVGAGIIQEAVWFYQVSQTLAQEFITIGPYTIPNQQFLIEVLPDYLNNAFLTVGASGAVFGILLAFGMLFPNAPMYLMFIPVPIKAKYLMIGYGLLELFLGVSNFAGDNIAHFAHLGGMIFGFFLIKYWQKNDTSHGGFQF